MELNTQLLHLLGPTRLDYNLKPKLVPSYVGRRKVGFPFQIHQISTYYVNDILQKACVAK